eukprot:NODE_62_length_26495_cov_0.832853.p18 type:complete len:152 gc:universal NODE_62_length_26495_cov_0.832853:4136-4591(+)
MLMMTYFAYYFRLTSLSTFSEADKFIKFIPIIAALQTIPDDIIYILGAWVKDTSKMQEATQVDGAFSGVVVLLTFLSYYAILFKKMMGYLTVSKKSVMLKVSIITIVLLFVDILLIVCNFTDRDMYNCIYSLSFTVKLVCVIELFDSNSWM